MTWHDDTFFERMVHWVFHLPWWLNASVLLLLAGVPFALSAVEKNPLFAQPAGAWRSVLFPIVGTAYVVVVAPVIWRAERAVAAGLAPLVRPEAALGRSWWRSTAADWMVFGLGVAGGAPLALSFMPAQLSWLDWYLVLTYSVMYGALAWLIYAALGSALLTARRLRTLRAHNPFDLTPFEPVGGQALTLALVFVGGITLSLFFVYTPELFFDWTNVRILAIYGVLLAATLAVFFGVMWPTHRTLARVKAARQAALQRLIAHSFGPFEAALEAGDACQPVARELETWLTLARRLEEAPTWPHNMIMLRTLALSALSPLAVAAFRVAALWLQEG